MNFLFLSCKLLLDFCPKFEALRSEHEVSTREAIRGAARDPQALRGQAAPLHGHFRRAHILHRVWLPGCVSHSVGNCSFGLLQGKHLFILFLCTRFYCSAQTLNLKYHYLKNFYLILSYLT